MIDGKPMEKKTEILVVEDSFTQALLIQHILEQAGLPGGPCRKRLGSAQLPERPKAGPGGE